MVQRPNRLSLHDALQKHSCTKLDVGVAILEAGNLRSALHRLWPKPAACHVLAHKRRSDCPTQTFSPESLCQCNKNASQHQDCASNFQMQPPQFCPCPRNVLPHSTRTRFHTSPSQAEQCQVQQCQVQQCRSTAGLPCWPETNFCDSGYDRVCFIAALPWPTNFLAQPEGGKAAAPH
jgi:hypothetical protein